MSTRERRGRPSRVPGERSVRRVEVSLTEAEYASLARLASELGTNVADAVRIAVAEQTDPDRSVDGQGRDQSWGGTLVFLSGHWSTGAEG